MSGVKKRITTADVHKLVDMSKEALEQWIRQGNCPFGIYLKKEGVSKGEYIIFEKRLQAFVNADDLKGISERSNPNANNG